MMGRVVKDGRWSPRSWLTMILTLRCPLAISHVVPCQITDPNDGDVRRLQVCGVDTRQITMLDKQTHHYYVLVRAGWSCRDTFGNSKYLHPTDRWVEIVPPGESHICHSIILIYTLRTAGNTVRISLMWTGNQIELLCYV